MHPNPANGTISYRSGMNPKIRRNFEIFTLCYENGEGEPSGKEIETIDYSIEPVMAYEICANA